MASEIKWTTSKGTAVELALITSRTINADGHSVEVPAYELTCVAGEHYVTSPVVIEHAVYGTALQGYLGRGGVRNLVVPIASEVKDQVLALVSEYHSEVARLADDDAAVDAEYEASLARIERKMAE